MLAHEPLQGVVWPKPEAADNASRWVRASFEGMPFFVERADGSGHRAMALDGSLLSEFLLDEDTFRRFLTEAVLIPYPTAAQILSRTPRSQQGLIDCVAFLDWWGSVGSSVWNQPPQTRLPHDTASSSPPYGTSTYRTPGAGGGGLAPGYHDRIALETRLAPTNFHTTPTNLSTNLAEAGYKAIVSPPPTATVATEHYSPTNLATTSTNLPTNEHYTPSSPSEVVVRAVNVSQRGAPASHQIMQIGGNMISAPFAPSPTANYQVLPGEQKTDILLIYICVYIYIYIYNM
jgi:hypothetical protein